MVCLVCWFDFTEKFGFCFCSCSCCFTVLYPKKISFVLVCFFVDVFLVHRRLSHQNNQTHTHKTTKGKTIKRKPNNGGGRRRGRSYPMATPKTTLSVLDLPLHTTKNYEFLIDVCQTYRTECLRFLDKKKNRSGFQHVPDCQYIPLDWLAMGIV